jgi:large subunit ribosomal protein L31
VKPGTHPEYYEANVRCACGHEFVVGSTQKEIRLDICSKCHPFFTGKQKFVDTAGRVDKYFRKYSEEAQRKYKKKKKRELTVEERAQLELEPAETPAETAEEPEAPVAETADPQPAAETASEENKES